MTDALETIVPVELPLADFTVDRAAFVDAAAMISRHLVERDYSSPILSCVLISPGVNCVTLRATDLDIQLSITVPAEGEPGQPFALDAAMLTDVMRGMPKGSRVSLRDNGEGRAIIDAGRATMRLPISPSADFPTLAAPDGGFAFALDGDTLATDLARLKPAISTEETRYYLNGVNVEADGATLAMVATDGHAMMRTARSLPAGADGLPSSILPRKLVDLVGRLLRAMPGVAASLRIVPGKRVMIDMPGVAIVAKLIDGTYPNWRRAFDRQGGVTRTLTVAAEALTNAAKLVAGHHRALLVIDVSGPTPRAGVSINHGGGAACNLAGEFAPTGEGLDAFGLTHAARLAIKACGGLVTLAWGGQNMSGITPATITFADAPELIGEVALVARDATLPALVPPRAVAPYTAPDGQAACLFDLESFDAKHSKGGEGPRKATYTEAAAYIRDYAARAGFGGKGSLTLKERDGIYIAGIFGKLLEEARYVEREVICYETFTTRIEDDYVPAQYAPGSYCVAMPGVRQPGATYAVQSDDGTWSDDQPLAIDRKGAVALSQAQMREMVGPIAKPVRARPAKRAKMAPVVQATEPPNPPEIASGEPVGAIEADTLPPSVEAVTVVETPQSVEPVAAETPLAVIKTRTAELMAMLEAWETPDAPDPLPAPRGRSAAHVRAIHAYLRTRRNRAAVRAELAEAVREHAVLATAAADALASLGRESADAKAARIRADDLAETLEHSQAAHEEGWNCLVMWKARHAETVKVSRKRRRALVKALRIDRTALAAATARARDADIRCAAALVRADMAERMHRLGGESTPPAPFTLITNTGRVLRAA